MKWTTLNFGKHIWKTLPQVVFVDADWFFWACTKGVFRKYDCLQYQAEIVYRRATRIKISQLDGKHVVAEYGIDPVQRTFTNVEIVPEDRSPHQGSTGTFRLPYFDLSVPRRLAPYDKSGCKALVRALKVYVFGNARIHLTKKRCEEFFEDESQFDLSPLADTMDDEP